MLHSIHKLKKPVDTINNHKKEVCSSDLFVFAEHEQQNWVYWNLN